MKKVKALVLFSGGLDSVITIKLLQEQGIEITAMYIDNGFHKGAKIDYLSELAKKLDVTLSIGDFQKEFFHMWKNPSYGYGKEVNPCVNCHALMVNLTEKGRENGGFDFIATGDVLEQRGNSQSSVQLKKVIKLIDNPKKVLRPLSALKLEETQMELDGIVDRTKFLGIIGKSRKVQYELLEKFGLTPKEVETPAGGCILTESSMTEKVNGANWYQLGIEEFNLFKFGRHIELPFGRRLILSRNEKEENKLCGYNGKHFRRVIVTNQSKSPIGFVQLSKDEVEYKDVSQHSKKLYKTIINETINHMKKYTKFGDNTNFQIKIDDSLVV